MLLQRTLGRTGLNVSVLSMGSGGFNKLGQTSVPPLTEPQMRDLVHRVFDLGINLFDTSPGYDNSELILGKALKRLPRDRFFVSTRVSLSETDENGSPVLMTSEQIVASIESSLHRLRLDTIDIALIAASELADFDYMINQQIPVLDQLCQEGKIRFLGSSETAATDGNHSWLRAALPSGKLDVIMIAHNMLNQSAQRSIFPHCHDHNIGVMNIYSVRNIFKNPNRMTDTIGQLQEKGLLDTAIQQDAPFDWLLDDPEIDTLIEAAYRYVVYTEGVTTAVCSAVSPDKVAQNIRSIAKGPLSRAHTDRIREIFGHLSEPVGN